MHTQQQIVSSSSGGSSLLVPELTALLKEMRREWKAEMLRLHESQHVRNLETRGVGFDSRILAPELVNAKELARGTKEWEEVWAAKGVAGVEVFQLDFVNC